MNIAPRTRSTGLERLAELALFPVVLAIFVVPYIDAAVRYGNACFPIQIFPDMYLYLVFSRLGIWSQASAQVDPWYHLPNSFAHFAYGKYYLGFFLFRPFSVWSGCQLASLVAWMSVIAAAVFFCLKALLRYAAASGLRSLLLLTAAVSAVFLFSPPTARSMIIDWAHFGLGQWERIGEQGLSLGRFMYPQFPILLLLINFLLLLRLLHGGRAILLVASLVFTQFATLLCFPYATIVVALSQFLFVIWMLLVGGIRRCLPFIALYVLLSGAIDVSYVWFYAGAATSSADAAIVVSPSFERFRALFGGTTVLLFAAAFGCGAIFHCVRRRTGELQFVFPLLASFSFATCLLIFSDALVLSKAQLSVHFAYFSDFAEMLASAAIGVALLTRFQGATQKWWGALAAVLVTVQACVVGISIYNDAIVPNHRYFEFYDALRHIDFQSGDVLLVPADSAQDIATMAPLVQRASVLFAMPALHFAAETPQLLRDHRLRYDLYAFFRGRTTPQQKDIDWLGLRYGGVADPAYNRIGTELLADFSRRQSAVKAREVAYTGLLQSATRIVVLQPATQPIFRDENLKLFLDLRARRTVGDVSISTYTPR